MQSCPSSRARLLRQLVVSVAALVASRLGAQQKTNESDRPDAAGEAIEMSAFTVSSSTDDGYRSIQTTSGSRTVENLKDIANSVSILNRELIDDLAATSMGELSEFSITGEKNVDPQNQEQYVFRGIVNSYQLRDSFIWYLPVDTFSMERVEILRGPNAFLYGEADPGGSLNQMTKRADTRRSISRARFMAGSYDLYRGEVDLNRPLTKTVSLRTNLVYQKSDGLIDYVHRNFAAVAAAVRYRPFQDTTIDVTYEYGNAEENRPTVAFSERYRTTERTGATATISNTQGSPTFFAGLGKIYNTVNWRQSTGDALYVIDEKILPRRLNFDGPDATFNTSYHAFNVTVEQRLLKNLNVQAVFNLQDSHQDRLSVAGGGNVATAIYLDRNLTLPDNTPNPNYNQYYTERFYALRVRSNTVRDWRLSATYDLELPFMKQRIVASGLQHQDNPSQIVFSEFVDPSSSLFTGSLINADTTAAHSANNTTLQRNYFRRRFYINQGDAENLTSFATIPGQSLMLVDTVQNSGASGRAVDRRFYSPSTGIGASGSYFGGRVRSMVGWRQDAFKSRSRRTFYNPVTKEEFNVAPNKPTDVVTRLSAYNAGGVVHATKWLSASFNYGQSYRISLGEGADSYISGTKQGLPTGDGYEAGLRWSFFGGRLESNWTYFTTNQLHNRDVAAPTTAVNTELGLIFNDINTASSVRDTQTVKSSGFEFETVANLFDGMTLSWNFATNEVETSDTLPQLRALQARAKAQNSPTPQTDAFVATVVNGTPVRGYTKIRTNLFARYRFKREGLLKGLALGGGFQLRDKSFLGNFDKDRDGVAEKQWGPGYELWNGLVSYSTKLQNRAVTFSLNVNNLFDKDYYRASSITAASWGTPRTYRFSTIVNF